MTSHNDKPHFHGHRQRVRQKFLSIGSTEGFVDYELLELTLFYCIPRKDVKPVAKELLSKYSLADLLTLSKEKFLSINGTNESIYVLIQVIKEFRNRSLRTDLIDQNIISSWNLLIEYLKASMGSNDLEQFRILFLNKKNILIADEVQTSGTIDETSIYPREVVKRTLFYEASSIILVHNHPSGDPKPSKSDIIMTQKVLEACKAVNIQIHDHVIICKNKFYSFKSHALL